MIHGVPGTPMEHAKTIVGVVRDRQLPREVAIIAIMTAITESGIRALINPNDPVSLHLPNDGVGFDFDSVGIFQQRPPWGPVEARLDPATSTGLFLDRLVAFGWTDVTPWAAAQRVQVSAFADGSNYHANFDTASALATQIWAQLSTGAALAAGLDEEEPMVYLTISTGARRRGWLTTPTSFTEVSPEQINAIAQMLDLKVQQVPEAVVTQAAPALEAVLK